MIAAAAAATFPPAAHSFATAPPASKPQLSHWSSTLLKVVGVIALLVLAAAVAVIFLPNLHFILPITAICLAVAALASIIANFVGSYFIKKFVPLKQLEESVAQFSSAGHGIQEAADTMDRTEDDFRQEVETLRALCSTKQSQIDAMARELTAMQQLAAERARAVATLEETVRAGALQTESLQKRVDTLAQIEKEKAAEIHKLQEMTEAQRQLLETEAKMVTELQAERNRIHKALTAIQEQISPAHQAELEGKNLVGSLIRVTNQYQAGLDRANAQIELLEKELREMVGCLEQVREQLKRFATDGQAQATSSMIAQLQEIVSSVKNHQELTGFLAEVRKVADAITRSAPTLIKEVLSVQDDFPRLQREMSGVNHAHETLEADLLRVAAANAGLAARTQAIQEEAERDSRSTAHLLELLRTLPRSRAASLESEAQRPPLPAPSE